MLSNLIGRRETGKTTLAVYMARRCGRRMIFDTRNGIFPRGAGVKVFTADDLIDDAYPALLAGEIEEVIYTPRENNLRDAFLIFSTAVQHHIEVRPRQSFAAVVDECALVKDDLEDMDHPFQAAMRWCKRDRVHFFLTCHQPKNVPTNTRAISDYLILFHATQEHDLRVIAERCSEQFAADVARLKPHTFLIWNDQLGVAMMPTIAPADWNLDLGEREEPAIVGRPTPPLDAGNLWL